MLALAAAAGAVATGPEDDYAREYSGKRRLGATFRGIWGSWGTPRQWLAYSHDSFQRIMWMLADRSAGLHGPYVPAPAFPRDKTHNWPGPPGGYEPIPPRWPDASEDAGDDGERPSPRREREESPDRRDVVWPGERQPHCQRAGAVVRGGGWYVVRPGDTLWRIAEAHYGDGRAWRRILRANWRTVPDANGIYACQRIYIPAWGPTWPPAEEPGEPPERRQPPIERVQLGPAGCSRCGGGLNAEAWGWR